MEELLRIIAELERRVEELESRVSYDNYQGTSASDFTTTNLPQHGDYGFQTTDSEIQVNCNGTIRAITTSVL